MKKFVLFQPVIRKYVSNIEYNRKTGKYNLSFTRKVNEIRVWKTKSEAEAQAQRIFARHRAYALEVTEIR